MLFFLDNNRDVLHDGLIPKMVTCQQEDLARPTKKNIKVKKGNKTGKRMISLRTLCSKELDKLMRAPDGTFYSPIKLIGNDALNYEAVQDFMMSKKAVKIINRDVAESAQKNAKYYGNE